MCQKSEVEIVLDDLGECATIGIDTKVFSEITIMKVSYWMTNDHYVYLSRISEGQDSQLCVELRLKEPSDNPKIQLEKACREFGNRLVDQEVRQAVLFETAVVRENLVKKAFFEGRRTDASNVKKSL